MTKLVGFKKFVSKKNGKEYCVANVVRDYEQREISNGCIGQKVEEIFLPEEKTNYLRPEHIGKELQFSYEISAGRAYIVDVEVVSK